MNRLRATLLLASASIPASANGQTAAGPYVSLGGGANYLQDQSLHGLFGGGSIRTDVGPAASAAVGYGLGNGIRVELQGDWRNDRLYRFGSAIAGGEQEQYGAFVNVLYDFDLTPFGLPDISPYFGLGAGYEQTHFLSATAFSTDPLAGGTLHSSGTSGDFAAQAILGLSFTTSSIPGLALTAEYRFSTIPEDLTANGQLFDADSDERAHIRTDGTLNQTALLGVRYAIFPPAKKLPPSAGVAAPSPAPIEHTRTYLVFFDWDRADLTSRARQIVAEAASASTRVQTTRIDVNGYTDLSGTADYNRKLSVRRADSVAAELLRDGVPKDEIVIRGLGETAPLVSTADGVREPQNRRVEIILH